MRIAAWNLNHRVGRTRYRPEAPNAAIALQADILVFTEFFPRHHESTFRTVLADAGYFQQLISDRPDEIANRVLIASVEPVEPLPLDLPTFDRQFPANLLAFRAPAHGLSVVAVRVPSYVKAEAGLVHRAWDWLESTAATLKSTPAVIIGDLNATPSAPGRTGRQFRGIVESGWILGAPRGGDSYFGATGQRSEIDHVLVTRQCILREAEYVVEAGGYVLAGAAGAISDHAALVCSVEAMPASQASE